MVVVLITGFINWRMGSSIHTIVNSQRTEMVAEMDAMKMEIAALKAVVATIQESDYGAVEVQARNDGKFVLTVHSQVGETDRWEDLSATLEPKHFEMLGSIARQQPVRA